MLKTQYHLKGFTLIELGIVLALLAILIAVMVPNVNSYILKTRVSRAHKECRTIADAITRFNGDTHYWPYVEGTYQAITKTIDLISSDLDNCPVKDPACAVGTCVLWDCGSGAETDFYPYLYVNDLDDDDVQGDPQDFPTTGRFKWKGPYLTLADTNDFSYVDPWGHAYMINARYFPNHDDDAWQGHNVMVLSAGPDGMIQTDFSDGNPSEEPKGDDIAFIFISND